MRSTKRNEGTVDLEGYISVGKDGQPLQLEQSITISKTTDGQVFFLYKGIRNRHDANVLLKLCDRNVRLKCNTAQPISA